MSNIVKVISIALIISMLGAIVFMRGKIQIKREFVPEEITSDEIDQSLGLATEWLVNNFREKGIFVYQYNPKTEKYSRKNNMIRQLMASRLLAELSVSDVALQKLHKKNLDFIFKYWYKEKDGLGYIYYNSKSKLGAIAMALRTLVYSPFYKDYADKAEKLANTVLKLQNKDGSFEPWFIDPDYNYDKDYLLTFYSGEAILSLVELYEKTKDEKYLKAAVVSQDFYIDRYVVHLEENYYPAYVPWHTLSLNKQYKITGNEKYAEAAFVLNDELLKIQNQTGEGRKKYLGRFYDSRHPEYGSPHSASDGVYVEGLAYAYELAKLVGDLEHQVKYKKAILLGGSNLINLQFKNPEKFKYPERFIGAVKYRVGDDRIRVDTVQHAVDALRKVKEIMNNAQF